MNTYRADLHLHTALSPCGEDDMTPQAIVRQARAMGLDIIAICDHNTSGNAAAVQEAAGDALIVIAGIEITTIEEVHVGGLFPDVDLASQVATEVLATLPTTTPEDTQRFGEQWFMDAHDHVLACETRMLATASTLDLAEAVALIKRSQGLAIAAHIDRRSFSILSQLGFFPEDARFDALELSAAAVRANRIDEFKKYGPPLIASSDSHFPEDIGICQTIFSMYAPSFSEIQLALQSVAGREIYIPT
jgi:predicted metal-dependent phosphoesterase TrpH